MKTKLITLLLLFFLGFGFAQTKDSLSVEEQARREKNIQAGNPFKKFGYKPKIATLSKGKYLEFHDLDSIVKIGSFTYHVKKKAITGFNHIDEKKSEATLSPEIISRWFSPDPLSDEFPSWSPYTFTNDNPIYFTDPTGLASKAFLNDYGVDQDGNVSLINTTDDKFDRLYAVDDDGNKVDTNSDTQVDESDSVVINDQSILPEISNIKETSTSKYHGLKTFSSAVRGEGSQNDLFKVFNFAANNSNVEWSLYRADVDGQNMFGLGTYHNPTLSPGATGMFQQNQVIAGIHSHANISSTMSAELDSMGGDRMQKIGQVKNGLNYPSYIYFPNSNRIFSVGNYGETSFIRNTKGTYKGFYFGTLNSQ